MIATQQNRESKITDPYLKSFECLETAPNDAQPSWIFPLRKAAFERFVEIGFPTVRDEDWRFTNVAPITKFPFKPILARQSETRLEGTAQFPFAQLHGHRLVFIDGHYSEKLSSPASIESGVEIKNLRRALSEDSAQLKAHFSKGGKWDSDAFTALNTAFFQDGALIHIRAGKKFENPVTLVHIATATGAGNTSHQRSLIVSEKGSKVTVLECFVKATDESYFTNTVSEISVGEDSVVEYCKFQDESASAFHIATIHAHLARQSKFTAHSFATGSKLSRNNIRVKMNGEGIDCILNGLYLTKGDQLCDHHMIVEHASPHCNSHEYFNGILDGQSRGVFHGRILVRPEAQKTDAKQTNKNLLLSDEATADTKPQLEIYADDVKCTHGATIGQLNEDSIFYLRARGIGLETARRMLIHAFAGEIIERIKCDAAREELDQMIWNRLEQNPQVTETR